MNFFRKAKLIADYIIISSIKNWTFYKHLISKAENKNIRLKCSDYDIRHIRGELERIIKRLIVFLPFKSSCIHRSLTIYKYLADIGIKSDFIVGVRLAPYSFHCWLEFNGEVIFDSPSDNRLYRIKTFKISEFINTQNFY